MESFLIMSTSFPFLKPNNFQLHSFQWNLFRVTVRLYKEWLCYRDSRMFQVENIIIIIVMLFWIGSVHELQII